MHKIELGSTGIILEKNGFGCLPIQRITKEEAADTFRQFQDFVNARCHTAETDFAARERSCARPTRCL